MNLMYVFLFRPYLPTNPMTTQVQTCNVHENMFLHGPTERYDIHAPKGNQLLSRAEN